MTDFQRLFPDNRQAGDSRLRKAQLVMLRILKIIDQICREQRLQYWLDGGTLLGAVRHQGFIPWDDDLDIVMPRTDFDRFLKIAPKELPEDLWLRKHKSDSGYSSHGIPPLKIVDQYSRVVTKDENDHSGGHGLFVDIIPVDKFGKGLFKNYRFMDYFLKRYYRYLCGHYNNPFDYKSRSRGLFRRCTSRLFKELPLEKMLDQSAKRLERRTRSNNTLQDNYWIGYCLEVPWMRLWEPDEIFPLQKMRFEDASFPVPRNQESVLKKFYGDYRSLPPVERRVAPHIEEVIVDIRENGKA